MAIAHISTKTDLIKTALQNHIQKEKSKNIKEFFGKIDLDMDMGSTRRR